MRVSDAIAPLRRPYYVNYQNPVSSDGFTQMKRDTSEDRDHGPSTIDHEYNPPIETSIEPIKYMEAPRDEGGYYRGDE